MKSNSGGGGWSNSVDNAAAGYMTPVASTRDLVHCLNAGSMDRQDFETETLIAHSLSADGFDASEDGTGRGVPMIPIAILTAHSQSNSSGFSDGVAHTLESGGSQAVAFNLRGRENGAVPEPSEMASLRAASGGGSNSYVAFSAKAYGADVSEVAPTLRGMGHESSHANGGGQLAVAIRLHGADGTTSTASFTETSSSLCSRAPGGVENSTTTAVMHGMAVRRLTPRECERLQGFPDDYTLVEYRGELAADGPRYRALSNFLPSPTHPGTCATCLRFSCPGTGPPRGSVWNLMRGSRGCGPPRHCFLSRVHGKRTTTGPMPPCGCKRILYMDSLSTGVLRERQFSRISPAYPRSLARCWSRALRHGAALLRPCGRPAGFGFQKIFCAKNAKTFSESSEKAPLGLGSGALSRRFAQECPEGNPGKFKQEKSNDTLHQRREVERLSR